jgi:uncharacterized MnhB-related membrane protein
VDKSALKLKYQATVKGILIFFGLLLLDIGLQIAKLIPPLHSHFRVFFSHTSNFIITSILMAIISLIWLLQGAPFKLIIWLGVVAITLNFIIELFVTFMNTPDVVDAIYGTVGVFITILAMFLIRKTGLQEA